MNSMSVRFASVTGFVALLILVVIGTINYAFLKDELLSEATQKAKLIESNSVYKIQTIMQKTKATSNHVKEYLLYKGFDKKSIKNILEKTLLKNDDFYGMAMAFEPKHIYEKPYSPYYYKNNSKIVYIDLALNNYNYLQKEWYTKPKRTLKALWSKPYYDEGGGNVLMSTYGNPILKDGKLLGILTIDFSLKKLQDIISSIHILKSGYAFLLSDEYNILIDPHSGKTITKYDKKIIKYNQLIKDGEEWIYYTHLKSTNLILGMVFPHAELFSSLHKISFVLILLGITGSILLVISIVMISRKITKPLKEITQLTHEISLGNFEKKLQLKKTDDEVYDLSCSINRMQDAIKHYIKDLKEATIKQQKIDSELDIARDIQMSMLPKNFQINEYISIEAILKPAKAVGGDFYDFFEIDKNKVCFVIADVSGKGVPAAMFMALSMSYIRAYSKTLFTPCEIVKKVNDTISANNDANLFVTLFLAVIDVKSGEVRYVNAGHNSPYILSGDKVEPLPLLGNSVVGAFEGMEYVQSSITLQKQQKIFLYTDGVTEAFSKDGECFGVQRLQSILKHKDKKILNEIKLSLDEFCTGNEQSDDITMLLIEFLSG